MNREEIIERLQELCDPQYRDFQQSLIPADRSLNMIGVRTPALRKLAADIYREGEYAEFLNSLPHETFEENQLHAFIISLIRDFDLCLEKTDAFLPYVDNWATCDQMKPKVFAKHKERLREKITEWLASDHTYTVRFAVGMLMSHFLDADFRKEDFDAVTAIDSDEYYVKMMQAWYFATALAKQYDSAVRVLEENRLPVWTHNKTIQKARESFRITSEQKEYLKTLKR